MWKGEKTVRKSLTKMVQHLLNHPGEIHDQFFNAKLVCIPKEKGGLRPIVLEETIFKIMSKAASILLTEQIAKKIHKNQFCLQTSNSQLLAVSKVRDYIRKGYNKIVSIDFTNAYGLVDRQHIISELQRFGVDIHLINFLKTAFEKQRITFSDKEGKLQTLPIEKGVLQGNACSTALFCVGVNKLLENFHGAQLKVVAYADDFVLLARDITTIEQAWESFKEEAGKLGMAINPTKTKVLLPVREEDNTEHMGLRTAFYNHGDRWTYLGLPITQSKTTMEEDLQEKLDSFVQTASLLWTSNVPMQMKYHLYQMCLVRKLVYYFRGAPFDTEDGTKSRYLLRQADKRLLSILPTVFRDTDTIIRSSPFRYGGLNMTNMEDLALICRLATSISLGILNPRDVPILKGVEARNATQELIHKRFFEDRIISSRLQGRLEKEKLFSMKTLLLRSPPRSPDQYLEDAEFVLYLDQLTNVDHTAPTLFPDITECPAHKGKECDTQHSLCCNSVGWKQVTRCHDDVVKKVMSILARNKNTSDRKFEEYTETQNQQGSKNGKKKRADIIYRMGGIQHSIDVRIAHKRLKDGKEIDAVKAGLSAKRSQYKGEPNIHLVVIGSDGNIAEETEEYLRSIGARNVDLKDIVSIVTKRMNNKLEEVKICNAKTWKAKRARKARRERYKARKLSEIIQRPTNNAQPKTKNTPETRSLERETTQSNKKTNNAKDKRVSEKDPLTPNLIGKVHQIANK